MIGSTTRTFLYGSACLVLALAAGCDKKKTSDRGGGTGGGGGAWLVGADGLMEELDLAGQLGDGYQLGSEHDLLGITCRGRDTAFVVGELGTLLRTFDAGASWDVVELGTTHTLRAVATSGPGDVYVAGDGVLVRSPDSGQHWTALPVAPSADWLAVAASHRADGALALDRTGAVVRYDLATGTTAELTRLPGARVVALSHDGAHAVVAGDGRTLLRSDDAGATWVPVDLGGALELHDAWPTHDGAIIAVGAAGTIARLDPRGNVDVWRVGAATLRTVHVDAAGHGFAAGDAGTVLVTHDAGGSWARLDLPLTGTIFGVDEVSGDGHD